MAGLTHYQQLFSFVRACHDFSASQLRRRLRNIDHCSNKFEMVLQAFGNGSMNGSWLSQTGEAEKSRQARTFRV
ncbi:hypothetical protein [Desulfonatronum parangueonense]